MGGAPRKVSGEAVGAEEAFAANGISIAPLRMEPACSSVTVDVEEWFDSNFRSAPAEVPANLPRRVGEGVERALELFGGAGVRATFFVLGEVAIRHPEVVRKIAAAGHEIACHHLRHDLVYEQSPERFASDLQRAKEALEDEAQTEVKGFRAPSWSITERSLWALEQVARLGFRFDSSIFPAANYLYGIAGAPRMPYRMRLASGAGLLELPPSVVSLGRFSLGVGGGLYLRVLPLGLHRFAQRQSEGAGRCFIAYIHPRELDPGAWELRLELSPLEQFLHRVGLRAVPRRLERLLSRGSWLPLGEIAARYADESPST